MGDWVLNSNGRWAYDRDAPSPSPDVTPIGPPISDIPVQDPPLELDDERYDHLAEQSFNGLRPEDELLPQPPQDPDWRPDAHG